MKKRALLFVVISSNSLVAMDNNDGVLSAIDPRLRLHIKKWNGETGNKFIYCKIKPAACQLEHFAARVGLDPLEYRVRPENAIAKSITALQFLPVFAVREKTGEVKVYERDPEVPISKEEITLKHFILLYSFLIERTEKGEAAETITFRMQRNKHMVIVQTKNSRYTWDHAEMVQAARKLNLGCVKSAAKRGKDGS